MVGGRRIGAEEKSGTANRQRLQAHPPFLCDPKAAKTRCLRTLFVSSASFVPYIHPLYPRPPVVIPGEARSAEIGDLNGGCVPQTRVHQRIVVSYRASTLRPVNAHS